VFSDTSNVTESYTKPYGEGFHFYADGTFKYVMGSAVNIPGTQNITMNGVTIWRGNYKAENGNLYLTNVKYSYTPRANDPSGMAAYKDKSAPDAVYKYAFGYDGNYYVQINIHPDITKDNDDGKKFYDMKYKTPAENK